MKDVSLWNCNDAREQLNCSTVSMDQGVSTLESRDPRDQSKNASSLSRRLSASWIPLVSRSMLPRLCIVGLIATRGQECWLEVLDRSALDPEYLMLPITERRKFVSELVPNLDKCVPTDERLRTFKSIVRRRDGGGAGNEE
jgi:hypothetical protein